MSDKAEIDNLARMFWLSWPDGTVEACSTVTAEEGVVDIDIQYVSRDGTRLVLRGEWEDPKIIADERFSFDFMDIVRAEWKARTKAQHRFEGVFNLTADGHWHLRVVDAQTGTVYRDERGCASLAEAAGMMDELAGRGDGPTDASAGPAPAPRKSSGLTVPELFGFIHEELSRDVPEHWESIIVEAEVFEEEGRRAVSMVSWYTTPDETEPVRFVPENTTGPMNALIELNEQNAPQGEPWRRVRLIYRTNGMVEVRTDPEGGT